MSSIIRLVNKTACGDPAVRHPQFDQLGCFEKCLEKSVAKINQMFGKLPAKNSKCLARLENFSCSLLVNQVMIFPQFEITL